LRLMGLEAIYAKPRLSDPAPGHRVYPYLLRGLTIEKPKACWATDITYIRLRQGFVYPGCDHGLVQPLRAVVGNIDQHGNEFLPDSTGLGIEESEAGNLQLGSRSAVHQPGIHESFVGSRDRRCP